MTEPVRELPRTRYRPPSQDLRSAFEESLAELIERAGIGALTAAADAANGAMVALVPSDADLDRLVVDGGEPREQLHLTLLYLGKAVDYDTSTQSSVHDAMSNVASTQLASITAEAFGANHWNVGTDSPSWVLAVGGVNGAELVNAHDVVKDVLVRGVLGPGVLPEQHEPWVPHVCLAYSADPGLAPVIEERLGNITFDRLRVTFGDDVTDTPLGMPGVTSSASRATLPPNGAALVGLEEVARLALRQGGTRNARLRQEPDSSHQHGDR